MQVAKLTADLFANTSKFEAGMSGARKSFKKFQKTVAKGAKIAAAAIAATGLALGALTLRQAGVIDETAKLSAALGVNIREFQALAQAASEAGITQDQMGTIITKSQRSIVEASRGLETYARSFETLNLEAKDLIKLSPEEQFKVIAGALNKVDNATIRTATALEIFGRSGRQVINMLGNFNENLESARTFNDKFGISLTKIDAAKVEEANDTFARLKQSITGLGNTLAVRFAPIITHISELFLAFGVDAESFGKAVDGAMSFAGHAIDGFRISLFGVKLVFTELRIVLDNFVLNALSGFFRVAEAMAKIPGLADTAAAAQESILSAYDKTLSSAAKNAGALQRLNKEALEFKTTAMKLDEIQEKATVRAKKRFENELEFGSEALDNLAAQAKGTEKVTDKEKERVKNAKELGLTFASAFEKAVDGGEKFSDVLQGLFKDIQNILVRRTITEPLDDLIKGIVPGASDGGGGFGDLLSFLPSFDVGTNYVPQDMIAQVHKGEMIVPAYDAGQLGNGGGDVVVNVYDSEGNKKSTSRTSQGGGGQFDIDLAVAQQITKDGSRTAQALDQRASRSVTRR